MNTWIVGKDLMKHHGHAKRVFKSLNNKNLGDYYDLYVQSDHYYLQMYLKIYELDMY